MTRRERILTTVSDAALDLLVYDRQDDQELPIGAIEEAILAGEITREEIIAEFMDQLP